MICCLFVILKVPYLRALFLANLTNFLPQVMSLEQRLLCFCQNCQNCPSSKSNIGSTTVWWHGVLVWIHKAGYPCFHIRLYQKNFNKNITGKIIVTCRGAFGKCICIYMEKIIFKSCYHFYFPCNLWGNIPKVLRFKRYMYMQWTWLWFDQLLIVPFSALKIGNKYLSVQK